MAKAHKGQVSKTVIEDVVVLTLTQEEAQALRNLIGAATHPDGCHSVYLALRPLTQNPLIPITRSHGMNL